MSVKERGFDSSRFEEGVAGSLKESIISMAIRNDIYGAPKREKNNSYFSKLPLITPFAVVRYTHTNYTNFPEQQTECRNKKPEQGTIEK